MKLSKRLSAIADMVEPCDSVTDIGCDHGYLSVWLLENGICGHAVAADIRRGPLERARASRDDHGISDKDMELILSDGLKEIDPPDEGLKNTLVIAGMGASTIKHILSDTDRIKNIKKIITQSNNDHEMLRKFMNNIGYFLENELYVLDKGKWYVTSCFIKDKKKNSKAVIKYGLLNNNEYNLYLVESRERILDRIPLSSIDARNNIIKDLEELKSAIL